MPPDSRPDIRHGATPGAPRDRLFATPDAPAGAFRFDQSVVDVFPDMLNRSIPGYQSIITQSGLLAARFARADSTLYDLGCSLAATSLSMQQALQTRRVAGELDGCRIVGLDNSPAMLEEARRHVAEQSAALTGDHAPVPVTLIEADIADCALENASVVAMNFTLQFIAPANRAALMSRIAAALPAGGALILSEKIRFSDPDIDALHIDMYHAFKRANGYSDLEISRKRTALENVLIPDTLETHEKRLREAGFAQVSVWFQCFNFLSLVAIRG